jgi:hypothetical protein
MKLTGLVIKDQVSGHGEGSQAQQLALVPAFRKGAKDGAASLA